jgi:DNA (cytosine-5)-methyltransferase 1
MATVLDLFAGVGGLSSGFKKYFNVIGAVEKCPYHAGTYEINFPTTKTICASVSHLTGSWILENLGNPTIVIGGPPCQAFSVLGKRRVSDPRVELIFQFARVVNELKPPYFLMENVKGLLQGKMRKFFDELCDRLSCHYTLKFEVLNALHYGVPQCRERVFLIGAAQGYSLPEFPAPSLMQVSTWEAISDLPVVEKYPELFHVDYLPMENISLEFSEYAASLRSDVPYLTGLTRTRHRYEVVGRYRATAPGTKEPKTHHFKLDPAKPAPTLLAGSVDDRRTATRPIHPYSDRALVVREGARLQGFKDSHRFHQSKHIAWVQVGNAVSPIVSEALAAEFAKMF